MKNTQIELRGWVDEDWKQSKIQRNESIGVAIIILAVLVSTLVGGLI